MAHVVVPGVVALHLHPPEVERGHAGQGDVETILEERLGEAEHSGLEAAVPSLQVVALGRCHDVGAHPDVPREGLLVAEHDVALPAVVAQVELLAAHVDVGDAPVQREAGLARGVPVDEGVEAGLLVAGDVAVGAVQDVTLVEAVLLDAVVADALTKRQVDDPLRVEEVVDKADVVYLLGVKVGVTITDRGWVRFVDIRVEQRDARPADAQVVGRPDVLRVVDLVGEVGRGDEVAVVQLEVVGLPQPGDDVLPRVLVAQARGERYPLDGAPVFGIARQDAVLVAVVEAARLVPKLLLAHQVVIVGARGVVAQDILGTQVELMPGGDRRAEVGLPGVLDGVVLRVGIAVGQVEEAACLVGVEPTVTLVPLWRGGDEVGEGEHPLPVVGEGMLVVDAPVDGEVLAVVVVAGRIAQAAHVGARLPVDVHAEAHDAGRGGEKVQRVDLVAHVQVAHLDVEAVVHRAVGAELALALAGELRAAHLRLALHREGFHDIGIDRHTELVLLHTEEGAAAHAPVGCHAADRGVVAVEELLAALARAVGDQVEHAADTLGVIARSRIGHHLDVLDAAGRHVLEDLGGVAAHHDVGLAVDIDLEAGAAVDGNVVVTVDGHHRDFA